MDSSAHSKFEDTEQGEVLRRCSFVEAFRTRKRQNLWLYLSIEGLMFLAIGVFFSFGGGIPASSWFSPLCIGIVVLGAYITWNRSSPTCPNCRKDVRICSAIYCHVCGEALVAKRCDRCGVLQSWMHIMTPMGETTGNKQPIRHCPSCAVLLDTDFHRWLGGGRHG